MRASEERMKMRRHCKLYYSPITFGRVQPDMVFFKVVSIELYALGPVCLLVLDDVLEPIFFF